MPNFYLHIRSGAEFVLDDEGMKFANLAAARVEATKGARSIMSADVLGGELRLDQSIEIHDGTGTFAARVSFSEALHVFTEPDPTSIAIRR